MTTEIYSCKEGQSLKQGKIDYSSHITTKNDAASDAERRCARDPSLKKIAYYTMGQDGEFRLLYSYTNPDCKTPTPKDVGLHTEKRVSKIVKKKTLWGKVKKKLGLK